MHRCDLFAARGEDMVLRFLPTQTENLVSKPPSWEDSAQWMQAAMPRAWMTLVGSLRSRCAMVLLRPLRRSYHGHLVHPCAEMLLVFSQLAGYPSHHHVVVMFLWM